MRWSTMSVLLQQDTLESFLDKQRDDIIALLQARMLRRAVPLTSFPRGQRGGALPVCQERAVLPQPIRLCLFWLGCPGACHLAALSSGATALVNSLHHQKCCP